MRRSSDRSSTPRLSCLEINRIRTARADVEYVVADLPAWVPESSYDVVFFSFWLSHVPRQRRPPTGGSGIPGQRRRCTVSRSAPGPTSSDLRAESQPTSTSASSPSGRLRCRIPSSTPALRNRQGTCPRWPRMQRGRLLVGEHKAFRRLAAHAYNQPDILRAALLQDRLHFLVDAMNLVRSGVMVNAATEVRHLSACF